MSPQLSTGTLGLKLDDHKTYQAVATKESSVMDNQGGNRRLHGSPTDTQFKGNFTPRARASATSDYQGPLGVQGNLSAVGGFQEGKTSGRRRLSVMDTLLGNNQRSLQVTCPTGYGLCSAGWCCPTGSNTCCNGNPKSEGCTSNGLCSPSPSPSPPSGGGSDSCPYNVYCGTVGTTTYSCFAGSTCVGTNVHRVKLHKTAWKGDTCAFPPEEGVEDSVVVELRVFLPMQMLRLWTLE